MISTMARQLENWTEAPGSDDLVLLACLNEKLSSPFPLDWYRNNPRLTMDRFIKFEGKPEFTPYYDEGDL